MANTRRRCRHCREYFPAAQVVDGFHSKECRIAHQAKAPRKSTRLTAYDQAFEQVRGLIAQRSRGICEARLPGCAGRPSHVHHRVLRSQGGTNDPDNLLHCCDRCHATIHTDVAASYERGHLLHSWDVR